MSKLEEPLPFSSPTDSNENLGAPWSRDIQKTEMLYSCNSVKALPSASASGFQVSSLNPSPLLSQDFTLHSALNTNRCEVGSNHILVEQNADNPSERNDFPGVGENHYLETMQTASSRPSSDYSIRSQVTVPQKGKFNEDTESCYVTLRLANWCDC